MFDKISRGTNAAVPIRFNELFQRWFFKIPDYQRGYSWRKKELSDYYKDIQTAMANPDEAHNFGAIQCKYEGVSYREPGLKGIFSSRFGTRKQKELLVSDGQQRMITTLLCLRALAERFGEHNKSDVLDDLIMCFYSPKITGIGGSKKLVQRLQLHHPRFNRCLRDLVVDGEHNQDSPTAVSNMKEALIWFRRKFETYSLRKCQKFRKALLSNTELIVVSNVRSNKHMVFEARNNRGRPVSELDKIKNLIQLIESRGLLERELDFPETWFEVLLTLEEFRMVGDSKHENRVVAYALSMAVDSPGGDAGAKVVPSKSYTRFREIFWDLTEKEDSGLEQQLRNFTYALPQVAEAYRQLRRSDLSAVLELPGLDDSGVGNPVLERRLASVAIHDIRRMDLKIVFESILIASYLRVENIDHFRIVVETAEKSLFRVYKAPDNRRVDYKQGEHSKAAFEIYNERFPRRATVHCLPRFSRGMTSADLTAAETAISYLCNFTINVAGKTLTTLQNVMIRDDTDAYDVSKQWGRYVLYEYEKAINPALFWASATDPFFKNKRRQRDFELEHIMPKEPRIENGATGPLLTNQTYWFRTGNGRRKKFVNENDRKAYLNQLGNLVMATGAGNMRFGRHPYRRTGADAALRLSYKYYEYGLPGPPPGEYSRVPEIRANFKQWDIDTIAARQTIIANWATSLALGNPRPRWAMDCECDETPNPQNIIRNPNLMTQEFINQNQDEAWLVDVIEDEQGYDEEGLEIVAEEEEIHDEGEPEHGLEVLDNVEDNEPEEQEEPELEDLDEDEEENEDEDEDEQDEHAIVDVQETPPIRVRSPAESIERLLYIEDLPHQIWIEKTNVSGEPGRQEGERALGRAIWSPEKNKSGQDIYKYMRDVNPGDLIIHLIDNERIAGVSVVKSRKIEHVKGLPNTNWDETTDCYLHELEGFKEVVLPFKRELFLTEHNRVELEEIEKLSRAVFFTKDLQLRQGHYLTPCIKKMANYLNENCLEKTGFTLPYLSNK